MKRNKEFKCPYSKKNRKHNEAMDSQNDQITQLHFRGITLYQKIFEC
ncbi:conserved hypothetical protein, partial [Trichinella spiralis]